MMGQHKDSYRLEPVSAPGETLLELLEEKNMLQTDLAKRMGRPIKTVNEIIRGKAAITSETAIQLERVTGVPAEFWNQRETNYRAYLASQKELNYLLAHKDWLKQFPIKEMIQQGWIQCDDSAIDQMISLLNFFGVATPEQWTQGWTKRKLGFRKAVDINNNMGAMSAWLKQGELMGHKIHCQPFHKERLLSSIDKIRQLTLERNPHVFIPQLQEIFADCGIAIVFIKPFQTLSIYVASYWLNADKALIQLSLRGKTDDMVWFSIFHGLGHLIKHSKKELFIKIADKSETKSREEHEANHYASETLLPSIYLKKWLAENRKLTATIISDFSKELNISAGIIVGELQHMQHISYAAFNELKIRYDWHG